MRDVEQSLSAVFDDLAARAPHDPELARTVRQRAQRRRTAWLAASTAAACVLGAGVVLERGRDDGGVTQLVPEQAARACDGTPTVGVLPVWARTGFSEAEPVMPYVRSRSGRVLGILFGSWSPGDGGRQARKVLWVWNEGPDAGSPVRLSAQRDGVGAVVTEGLPMPWGPSTVELPSSGCWRLTLSSGTWSDTVDVDTRR